MSADRYRSLYEAFRWQVPAEFNLAHMQRDIRLFEIGDVFARRVGIARHGQPADDPVRALGDEHCGVGRAADRAQVAALLRGGPPLAVGDEPAFGLGADGTCELHELARVAGVGTANAEGPNARLGDGSVHAAQPTPAHSVRRSPCAGMQKGGP